MRSSYSDNVSYIYPASCEKCLSNILWSEFFPITKRDNGKCDNTKAIPKLKPSVNKVNKIKKIDGTPTNEASALAVSYTHLRAHET